MTYQNNTEALFVALPLLAQVLGDKYGVKVKIGEGRPCTDGNTIYLPTLPPEDPDTAALALGYIDHECGHVRSTDMAAIERSYGVSPFFKSLVNSLEDVRIEDIMGTMYPGARNNLARLMKIMIERGDYKKVNQNNPGELVTFYLLFLLRSQVLGQTGFDELSRDACDKMDAEYPGLRAEIEFEALNILDAKNTDDVYTLAEKVQEAVKKYIKEPPLPPEPPQEKPGDGDESGTDQQEGDDAQGGSADSNDDQQNKASSSQDDQGSDGQSSEAGNGAQPDDSDDNDNEQGENSDSNSANAAAAPDATSGSEDQSDGAKGGKGGGPEWSAEQAAKLKEALTASAQDVADGVGEKLKEILEEASDDMGSAEKRSASPAEPGFAQTKVLDASAVEGTVCALMDVLFSKLQEDELTMRYTSSSGKRLDKRRLYRAAVGDPRCRVQVAYNEGHDTALHVVLDRSGSMRRKIDLANDAMLAVKLASEGIPKLNLGMSAFPGPDDSYIPLIHHGEKETENKIGIEHGGGTPLAQTLWAVGSEMMTLSEKRKVVFVVTDGEPDDGIGAKTAIRCLENAGIETVGIGIGFSKVASYFDNSCSIHDISDLPGALFAQLERVLI